MKCDTLRAVLAKNTLMHELGPRMTSVSRRGPTSVEAAIPVMSQTLLGAEAMTMAVEEVEACLGYFTCMVVSFAKSMPSDAKRATKTEAYIACLTQLRDTLSVTQTAKTYLAVAVRTLECLL